MNQNNMSTRFIHSVKVPRLFKESTKIVKKVLVDGANFKALISTINHPNVQGIYALVSNTLKYSKKLDYIIDKTKLLIENPRLDPWLSKVLITELLWGKNNLKSKAKPVEIILNYKEKLQQALAQNLDTTVDPYGNKKVKLPRYVRVNTLLVSIDEVFDNFYNDGWNLLPRCECYTSHLLAVSKLKNNNFIQDFHVPEVLVFPPGTKFYDHPGQLNGKLLLQDKSSCLPAFLLNPKSNSEILDMCAAPGMKTTHLASIINNNGKIYAVEMNNDRYKSLCDFITHTNAECIEAIKCDALTISPEQYPNIKYILVDPSCSGSGIINRIEIKEQNEEDLRTRLKKLQNFQSLLLTHALLDFPNVAKVIYSTCSIYPEENECVIDKVLQSASNNFKLVNLKKKLKGEWHNFGSVKYTNHGNKCLYALPEKDLCRGFFMAMFKKKKKKLDNEEVFFDTLQISNVKNNENENKEYHEIPLKKRHIEKSFSVI